MEICSKTVFQVFRSFFRLEGGVFSQKGEMGVPICFRDKLAELPLRTLGNRVFFHLSLPKIWLIHPTKIKCLD